MTDLALIVIATAALTAAVCLVAFHFYLRSYRATLTRVRARRDAYKAEVQQLREERLEARRLTLDEHTVADERYWPTEYMPAFDGDNTAVAEYRQLAAAARQVRKVAG